MRNKAISCTAPFGHGSVNVFLDRAHRKWCYLAATCVRARRHHHALPALHGQLGHETAPRNEQALRNERVLLRELALLRERPDELLRRAQLAGLLPHVLRPGHAPPVNAADSEDGFPLAPRLWLPVLRPG
jgi:hypothetical protein